MLVSAKPQHESTIDLCKPLPLEPFSHPPPHPTPLDCHGALGLSFLCHIANDHWLSILHMVMYMFPCYSFNSGRPLPPPLCHQVRPLCLHLHCSLAYRIISTIFLDSIYNRYILWINHNWKRHVPQCSLQHYLQ